MRKENLINKIIKEKQEKEKPSRWFNQTDNFTRDVMIESTPTGHFSNFNYNIIRQSIKPKLPVKIKQMNRIEKNYFKPNLRRRTNTHTNTDYSDELRRTLAKKHKFIKETNDIVERVVYEKPSFESLEPLLKESELGMIEHLQKTLQEKKYELINQGRNKHYYIEKKYAKHTPDTDSLEFRIKSINKTNEFIKNYFKKELDPINQSNNYIYHYENSHLNHRNNTYY